MSAALVIIPSSAVASATVTVLAARRWLRRPAGDDGPLAAPVADTLPRSVTGAPYRRGGDALAGWWDTDTLPHSRVFPRQEGGPAAGMTRAGGKYAYPELAALAAELEPGPPAPPIPAGRAELPIVPRTSPAPEAWTGPLPIEQAAAAAVARRGTVAQAPAAESGEEWLARTARDGQAWLARMTAEYAPHQMAWAHSPEGRRAIRAEVHALAGPPRRLAIAPPA